jgi:hypothetical protein
MNPEALAYVVATVGLVVCAVVLGLSLRGAARFSAELLAGVGEVSETLLALKQEFHAAVGKLSELQAPNALVTRVADLETKVQGAQLTVADAVERVTALANRQAARQSRAAKRDALLDEEDEDEPVSEAERQEALAALAGRPGNGGDAGEGTPRPRKASGSGWDRVRRAAAARNAEE